MKKSIFGLSLLTLILSACNNSKFYDKFDFDFGIIKNYTPYQINDTKTIDDTSCFAFHGRHYNVSKNNAEFFDFSASGFEVTFTGTSLEGYFLATNANDNKNRPYLAVAIDNDYNPDHMIPIVLTSGVNSNCTGYENGYSKHEHIVLAHDLTNSKHTARIFKRSEANNSKVGIKSVSTDGTFNTVESKSLDFKIEFYGDSVTCGYAVESNDYYENFSTRTENAMKSYAAVAANKLNADYSLISCGGYPIYQSKYSKGCSPDTIPAMLSLASSSWGSAPLISWDNTKFIPDVVVIAMGANDGSVLNTYTPGSAEFNNFVLNMKNTYKKFIDDILIKYPNTQIVVSSEILPLGNFFEDLWDDIANSYNDEHPQISHSIVRAKYTAYETSKNRTLPGEGHPNCEMQEIAGNELAQLIQEVING